jgi:hypothetical protein
MEYIIYLVIGLVALCIGIGKYLQYRNYKKAKYKIKEWVLGYRRRLTGVNRFVVTVETLQDYFIEYDTPLIEKIWLDLIKERVIEQDAMDNEWCIKKGIAI